MLFCLLFCCKNIYLHTHCRNAHTNLASSTPDRPGVVSPPRLETRFDVRVIGAPADMSSKRLSSLWWVRLDSVLPFLSALRRPAESSVVS